MSESVVDIKDFLRSFGKKVALDKVDRSVPQRNVVGLVGENGTGKTTLLKHVPRPV